MPPVPQNHATPRHVPLIYSAAEQLGVDRATLKRAVTGEFPNPGLVAGYRKFALDYIDLLTLPAAP